jgi:deferrochelatase/peroxidase EfeB
MSGRKISRRRVLAAGGVGGAGVLLAGHAAAAGALTAPVQGAGLQTIDCHGEHQAGITTATQRRLEIAAFDLTVQHRAGLIELLRAWQPAIERLTRGESLADAGGLGAPPVDTGEATDLGASKLTITIGFGPTMFDRRFGLASRRPSALIDLPAFAGDQLDGAVSNGDISVQACADSQIVVEHAIRDLARVAKGAATLRWLQSGFDEAPMHNGRPQTGRNLLGFKDGTANLDATDPSRMRRNVWAAASDGAPWMAGGSYQVYRRVRTRIAHWDAAPLKEQQDVFGRYKTSGAPYGASNEFDPVVSHRLPATSHVRLANPRAGKASEDERILRRGYSYHDGYDQAAGDVDAGLVFIAYQRDPRRQFVTIQTRLAANDALNEYAVHTASGIFAIPPGVRRGDYVGSGLLGS